MRAVLFDLDGTLLPLDQNEFIKVYFKLLAKRMSAFGYEPKQLIDSVWAGTKAMIMNDGRQTNEQAFWATFAKIHGEDSLKDKEVLDAFYQKEFTLTKETSGFHPMAKECVDLVKKMGKLAVLATNPIFPSIATKNRMSWAGLSPEDFALYTTYETCCFAKPNPKYYLEILEKIGCEPEECLMVGNDVSDDMVAETLGMKVFLLTGCLINKEGVDIAKYPNGGFEELKQYLKNVLAEE